MSDTVDSELVFVVDVSSFTKGGFVGTTSYEGKTIEIEFDDDSEGAFLTAEMAKRLKSKKGTGLSVIVEEEKSSISKVEVGGIRSSVRLSDPKVYYAVGKEGGAVVRIRRT
ncbi:MAG TPA: hypothetical protein VFE91_02665 [Nitrososphaerales archaeon]|nr:hypothetical protein [Nitrososphaerales archaeon]